MFNSKLEKEINNELDFRSSKSHIIACWVAIILNPIFLFNDFYVLNKENFYIILLIKVSINLIVFTSIIFRSQLKITYTQLGLIPFFLIIAQNAYQYSIVETLYAFQIHSFSYITLFIGAGMLFLWNLRISLFAFSFNTIIIIACQYLWGMEEMSFKTFLVNGGAMTISSSIFMILLINIRYRLTIKNIKSEHKLQNANNEIKSSIEYAEKIQKTILPSEKILKKYFENIFVFYLPRDIVSGDFYWLYNKNNKTYIAVVDCTGHGVPGAFLSFIGNDILIDAMKMDSTSSSSILLYLHKEIHERLNKYEKEENIKDSMDISLCIFNHEENTICFSGINNPLLLIRGNESTLIKGEGINLGDPSTNESQFRSHTIPILKGDIIYLYSDGFQDQFGGPKGRKVMSKTFRELIIKNSSLEMTEQKNKLQSYLKEWKKDEEQVDDITIIGIKY